jgi:hypothetical protein
MNSLERFSFAGPDVRLRTSTVEGLSNTASFCIETRLHPEDEGNATATAAGAAAQAADGHQAVSPLGW